MGSMSQQIEQLWAIQSTDGTEPIICAASSGLYEDKDMLQALQPYLSYTLPPEWDMQEDIRKAPISLSLRNIGNSGQRTLIRKLYVEEATQTRAGTYFTHVLTNLPNTFSALKAIELWRSDFWESASKKYLKNRSSLNPNNVAPLDALSLDKLISAKKMEFPGLEREKIDRHLSYVIQAHLLQQQMLQIPQDAKPLYIVADSDLVAYLLFSLFSLIPQQLQKSVTFSTYENYVARNRQCMISGTYTPPNNAMYINYNTSIASPLPMSDPLHVYYARYVARCWMQNNAKELGNFFRYANEYANFTKFLSEYRKFHNFSNRSEEAITKFLHQPAEKIVSIVANDENIRANLIDWALIEDDNQLVTTFRSQLAQMSLRGDKKSLAPLQEDIIAALSQAAETNDLYIFLSALDLLKFLPPSSDKYISLLHKLTKEAQIINRYWQSRIGLLVLTATMYAKEEPQKHWEELSLILAGIKSEELKQLLVSNNLASNWLFLAMMTIPEIENIALSVQQCEHLERLLSNHGGSLIRKDDYVHTILAMLACVIRNGCTNPLPILFNWLDQPLEQSVINKNTLEAIFKRARLSSEQCEIFFKHYSTGLQPAYISIYPDAVMWQTMLRVFAEEQRKVEKMNLLSLCLNGLKGHQDLPVDRIIEQLFEAVAPLSVEEIVKFFENYEHNSAVYKTSPTVRALATQYVNSIDVARLQKQETLLSLQMISEVFPNTQARVHDLINIDAFLKSPTTDINTIRTLGTTIDHLEPKWHNQLITPVAMALIGCIDDVFQLSSTIATLEGVCRDNYSRILLQTMVTEVNKLFKLNTQTFDPEVLQSERLHLSLYVHYLLVFETLYENSRDFIYILLNALLYGINEETFQSLNKIAAFWPQPLREQWHRVEQSLNLFRLPMAPPPAPQSTIREESYVQFMNQEEQGVYNDEYNDALRIMKKAQSEKGAKSLALVFIKHEITFMQHMRKIDLQTWEKMKVLSAFYTACQQANAIYPPDPLAEQAIMAIVDNPANKLYLSSLTKKENKRIALAQQRSQQTTQSSPGQSIQPSMNASSRTPSIVQGNQKQAGPSMQSSMQGSQQNQAHPGIQSTVQNSQNRIAPSMQAPMQGNQQNQAVPWTQPQPQPPQKKKWPWQR